jgi:hypothetical protein
MRAIAAQIGELGATLNELADQVAALEEGQTPVDPPVDPPATEESADGTTITSVGPKIIDATLTSWAISEGAQVLCNDAVDQTSNRVDTLYYAKTDPRPIYQRNVMAEWYSSRAGAPPNWTGPVDDPTGDTPVDPPVDPPIDPPVNPPGDANVTIDFSKQTGRKLSKYLFGFSTGALGDNGWQAAADGRVKTSLAKLRPTLIRVNANMNFPEAGGDISNMQRWLDNYRDFCDPDVRMVMGVQNNPRACGDFARAMKDAGFEIHDWEAGNEMSDDAGAYASFFNEVYDTLKDVDQSYRISGTQGSWWNQINMQGWLSGIGSRMPGGLNYHSYPVNLDEGNAQIYSKAASQTFSDCRNAAGAKFGSVPFWYNEYNMNGNPQADGVWGDPRQASHIGLVFVALQLPSLFRSDDHVEYMAMWDAVYDGNYGAVANHQMGEDPTRITLQGYYLGLGGQMLPGDEVAVTSDFDNFYAMATITPTGFAAQFVNADLGTVRDVVPGFAGRAVRGPFTVVTMGKNNAEPATTHPSDLSRIPVPSESVVLISGGLG